MLCFHAPPLAHSHTHTLSVPRYQVLRSLLRELPLVHALTHSSQAFREKRKTTDSTKVAMDKDGEEVTNEDDNVVILTLRQVNNNKHNPINQKKSKTEQAIRQDCCAR